MIKVTVEGATLSELKTNLAAVLAALVLDGPGKPAAVEKADPEDLPTRTRKPAAEKPAPAAEADEPGLDYTTDVRPLVIKLSKDHGREQVATILEAFETESGDTPTKAQEVQEKDWAALVAAVNKAQKKLDKAKAAAEDE